MQSRKVTLDTIANRLGITKVSVSKALNNQPGVSESLRKKILQTSSELGYLPKSASKQASNVSKLGIVVPKRFFLDTDNFYTKIYYHMNQECTQLGISLSIYLLDPEQEQSRALPLSLAQDASELSGLFIAGEVSDSYVELLAAHAFPVIAIDFYKTDLELDCVIPDNFQSGYAVTKYLIDRGHSQIGFVGNPRYPNSPGSPAAVAEIVTVLRTLAGHTFWADDISLFGGSHADPRRILAPHQVTDTYLLALAQSKGGVLATLDRKLSTAAVAGGRDALHHIGA